MPRWNVKQIAEQQGLTSYSLAKHAGLNYKTVRPIWLDETDSIRHGTLVQLAKALGVKPGDLVGEGLSNGSEEE